MENVRIMINMLKISKITFRLLVSIFCAGKKIHSWTDAKKPPERQEFLDIYRW